MKAILPQWSQLTYTEVWNRVDRWSSVLLERLLDTLLDTLLKWSIDFQKAPTLLLKVVLQYNANDGGRVWRQSQKEPGTSNDDGFGSEDDVLEEEDKFHLRKLGSFIRKCRKKFIKVRSRPRGPGAHRVAVCENIAAALVLSE